MEPLSEELVDEICMSMSEFTLEMVYNESVEVTRSQPEIIAFIVELTEDIDPEIKELAIYMFFVIHRMFEKAYGKTIEEITSDETLECYEKNEKLIESLEGVHEKFFESIAKVQMSSQPYVIRYIVETLFEATQDDEPILIGEEDMGYVFLIMKTVVDVLDSKTED